MGRWIETVGTVCKLTGVQAPLSGQDCVLYQINLSLLQRLREGPRGGASSLVAGAAFSLTAEGRALLIDPRQVVLQAWPRRRHRVRPGRDPAAALRMQRLYRLLARRLGPRLPGIITGLERRVQHGDLIRIAGWLEQRIDPRGHPEGYRAPPVVPVLHARWLTQFAGNR